MRTLKLLFVVLVASIFTGCSNPPTEGVISVIDLATSAPVPNANVKVYVDNPSNPDAGFYICNESELTQQRIYKTSAAGVTEKICFKLPAVLKVEVTAPDGKTGTTTLSAVEGETTTVTCKVSN